MSRYDYCASMGLASSTAALTHGCRCESCAPWYASYLEQRREGRPAKVTHVESPLCSVHACKASTAYKALRCRCATCRGWNAGRERRRKAFARTEARWVQFWAEVEEDPQTLIHFLTWMSRQKTKAERRHKKNRA